jgi:hypothetical protein
MSQRYRRDMYPYQQQSIPFTQAVPQSQYYHPSFEKMMSETMQQTQNRHDQVVGALAEQMATFGNMETYSPDKIGGRLQEYQKELDSIVKDYNGNFAHAATALTRKMAQEVTNPLYQFNREHVRNVRLAQELENKFGPANTLWINDPRQVSLDEVVQTGDMTKLQARAVQAPDYTANAYKLMQSIEKEMTAEELKRYGNIAGYLVHKSSGGISESRLDRLAEQWVDVFVSMHPEIPYDNRQNIVPWLKDWETGEVNREGIKNFLTAVGSGRVHTIEDAKYMVDQFDPRLRSSGGGSKDKPSPTVPPLPVYRLPVNQEQQAAAIDKEFKAYEVPTKPVDVSSSPSNWYKPHNDPQPSYEQQVINYEKNKKEKFQKLQEDYAVAKQLATEGYTHEEIIEILKSDALRKNSALDSSIALDNTATKDRLSTNVAITLPENLKGVFFANGKSRSASEFKSALPHAKIADVRVIPVRGQVELSYTTKDGGVLTAQLSAGGFDEATTTFLEHGKSFFNKVYDSKRVPTDLSNPNFTTINSLFGEVQVATVLVNDVSTKKPYTATLIRPKYDDSSVGEWEYAEDFTGRYAQMVANQLVVSNSLSINIPAFKADIWNN